MITIITDSHTQADGRIYVTEIHSDNQGEYARFNYLMDVGNDSNGIAQSRSAQVINDLAQMEIENSISNNTMPTLRFQNAAQFVSRLRNIYRGRDKDRLALVAVWIRDRIAAGDLTKTQVRNAFGLNTTQWTAFEGRMQNLASAYDSVNVAVGE